MHHYNTNAIVQAYTSARTRIQTTECARTPYKYTVLHKPQHKHVIKKDN